MASRLLPLLALLLLLAACGRGREVAPAETLPAQIEEPIRQVRVVTAEVGVLSAVRSASVSIEAARESRVAAGITGRVVEILAREGQNVAEGAVVIVLEEDDLKLQVNNAELALRSAEINLQTADRATREGLEQIQAQVRATETSFDLATRQYQEGQALFEVGGIAATELQGLEAQRDQAESAMLQARDALARSQRASDEDLALLQVQVQQARNQLQQARDALSEASIRAPFAGEVAEVFVEAGEFVAAGSPAFRITGADEQVGTFNVSPEDAIRLRELGEVTIGYAGRDYHADITRTASLSAQQRLVTLTARLRPSEVPIPNGTTAQVRYQIDLGEGLLLPSSAVSAEQGRTFVFIAEAGQAVRREIDLLAEAGAQVLVEGLQAGASVIAPRPLDVREGTRVRVIGD